MSSSKPDLLANFVERHRADFDVHEPPAALWAAVEARLHPVVLGAGWPDAPTQTPAGAAVLAAAPAPRAGWWPRYGAAAGLLLLAGAAGLADAWKTRHPAAAPVAVTTAALPPSDPAQGSAQVSELADATAQPASLGGGTPAPAADSQLTAAVRGLEAYYAAQLAPRRAALLRLDTARTGTPAAWRQQLTSLDASYRQLRQELWQHPQPEMLLSAMNRNLQVRLDLLDQQLRRSTVAARDATAGQANGSYLVADSHRQP